MTNAKHFDAVTLNREDLQVQFATVTFSHIDPFADIADPQTRTTLSRMRLAENLAKVIQHVAPALPVPD